MSPVATSTLGQLRIELADTLDDESVVVVHRDMVDAPSPPCLLLGWAQPWLEPMGVCVYTARPAVICIAGRIEPGPGLEILEGLVADAVVRLRQRWPIERIEIPSASDFAGITYLTARVIVRATITL